MSDTIFFGSLFISPIHIPPSLGPRDGIEHISFAVSHLPYNPFPSVSAVTGEGLAPARLVSLRTISHSWVSTQPLKSLLVVNELLGHCAVIPYLGAHVIDISVSTPPPASVFISDEGAEDKDLINKSFFGPG